MPGSVQLQEAVHSSIPPPACLHILVHRGLPSSLQYGNYWTGFHVSPLGWISMNLQQQGSSSCSLTRRSTGCTVDLCSVQLTNLSNDSLGCRNKEKMRRSSVWGRSVSKQSDNKVITNREGAILRKGGAGLQVYIYAAFLLKVPSWALFVSSSLCSASSQPFLFTGLLPDDVVPRVIWYSSQIGGRSYFKLDLLVHPIFINLLQWSFYFEIGDEGERKQPTWNTEYI